VSIKCSLLAIFTLLVMSGCGVPDETIGTIPLNSDNNSMSNETIGTPPSNLPSTSEFSPLNVTLYMEKAPRLNEAAIVICSVKSIGHDAPNTTAIINLPEGAVLVSGNLDWQGDLTADVPVQFSAVIKFVEEGRWIIEAFANHTVDESYGWRDDDYINVDVRADAGTFFRIDASTTELIEFDSTYQPQPNEIPPQPKPDPKGEEVLPPEQ